MDKSYGVFSLHNEYRDTTDRLYAGANFVGYRDEEIFVRQVDYNVLEYDSCFLLIVHQNQVIITGISGNVSIDGRSISSPYRTLKEGEVLSIEGCNVRITFKSKNDESVIELIDQYLNGHSIGSIRFENLLHAYVDIKSITEKQAAFIMASIDIPEFWGK